MIVITNIATKNKSSQQPSTTNNLSMHGQHITKNTKYSKLIRHPLINNLPVGDQTFYSCLESYHFY